MEPAALARYEAAVPGRSIETEKRKLRREQVTGSGNRWALFGIVDATDDDSVVETKQRQRRLFNRIPTYEMPQLQAYMYMAGVPRAVQNEDYHGERNEHHVEFDAFLWSDQLQRLHDIVDGIYAAAAAGQSPAKRQKQ